MKRGNIGTMCGRKNVVDLFIRVLDCQSECSRIIVWM